ncbi:MAG: hypothetical protein ACREET_14370, partial [Stellaceae bacterium]
IRLLSDRGSSGLETLIRSLSIFIIVALDPPSGNRCFLRQQQLADLGPSAARAAATIRSPLLHCLRCLTVFDAPAECGEGFPRRKVFYLLLDRRIKAS